MLKSHFRTGSCDEKIYNHVSGVGDVHKFWTKNIMDEFMEIPALDVLTSLLYLEARGVIKWDENMGWYPSEMS